MSVYIERAQGLKPIVVDHDDGVVTIKNAVSLDETELRRLWMVLSGSLASMKSRDVVVTLPR